MQDTTGILTSIQPSPTNQVQNLSVDDIHIIKKYGLDVGNVEIGEHDYAIPNLPDLSLLTENVVGYIAGFVLRMLKRHTKCVVCIFALHDVASSSSTIDSALLLLEHKNRGGLIRPSPDLMAVLVLVEKYIKKILNINDDKLPFDNNFF